MIPEPHPPTARSTTRLRPPVRRLLLAAAALAAATLAIVGCGPEAPTLVRRPATPPPALLIRHVGVLDVAAGQRVPDRDVLVRGGRIAAIGLGGDLPAPADAREIDGGGATLLPGLIDVHGHVGLDSGPSWERALPDVEANLRAYLYAGVTTLLDPGDGSPDAVERRDRIARGELLGPTIFTAGKLVTSPGGHPIPLLEASLPFWLRWFVIPGAVDTAGTPAEARSIAAARADEGVDFLKLIVDRIPLDAPRMDVETLDAAVEEAHARGLRAIAHIGDVRDALDTGHAGIDAWMHAVYKERIPDALVGELAGFGIPMVPTLTVWHSYAALGRGPRTSTRLERETVPADVLAAFDSPPEDSAISGVFRPYLDALDARRAVWGENVRKLHAAGVVMLAGSDTQSGVFPGAGLHREIGYLHAAGLSPAEAIRAATLAPARFLAGRDDPDFGEVAVGKRADLLLVRGDPLADLDALADVREVILRGVPLERTPIGARPARP